jgi:alkylation response protein AidB-like acyl-CoA dehydrogenase
VAAVDLPPPAWMDAELEMFADSAAAFFRRECPPERVARWREAGQVDREVWRAAGEAGLLGVSIAAEHGGGGGDFRHDVVLFREQAKAGVEGLALSLHNGIVVPYIAAHGTEEQKVRWLPKLCSGELVSAIAMSEPGAGSDLQSIRTTAVRDGNGYRLNGAKTFISNGQLAELIVVVAKTDANQGARGTSLLVLETEGADGFRRGGKLDKIGNEAQDTSELFFDEVFIPADHLLGGEEGRGFFQLMAELPRERLVIAAQATETMERAIATTLEYVRGRKAFGQALADFQNTQFVLADCKAKATVARAFVDGCVARVLDGSLDNPTAAIAKLHATEACWAVVDACLQLHGGYGYVNDYPIARLWRNARVERIYGGSSEIMKLVIARSL